jgi:hypothetical protein
MTVAVGDIVLVQNPNLQGGARPTLGIVMSVPDGNNNVRVASAIDATQFTVNATAISSKVTPVAP